MTFSSGYKKQVSGNEFIAIEFSDSDWVANNIKSAMVYGALSESGSHIVSAAKNRYLAGGYKICAFDSKEAAKHFWRTGHQPVPIASYNMKKHYIGRFYFVMQDAVAGGNPHWYGYKLKGSHITGKFADFYRQEDYTNIHFDFTLVGYRTLEELRFKHNLGVHGGLRYTAFYWDELPRAMLPYLPDAREAGAYLDRKPQAHAAGGDNASFVERD